MTKAVKAPIAYEERLCLFLDILGFKAKIDDSARDPSKTPKSSERLMTAPRIHGALSAISSAMNPSISSLNPKLKSSKQVSQFSDSIVVSYRLDERGVVFDMLYDIYLLQIQMVQRGFLVRGAITIGKLFHDKNIVFGPALVEAAELEKLAMYPRVILGQDIVLLGSLDMYGNRDGTVDSLVKLDLDGMYYIDYFGVSPGEFNDGWDDLYQYFSELREVVKNMSYLTRNLSIKLKHSWMRQKFNDIAEPMEKSKFKTFNGSHIAEETQDAFVSAGPFK
jgi:hypothetical protein